MHAYTPKGTHRPSDSILLTTGAATAANAAARRPAYRATSAPVICTAVTSSIARRLSVRAAAQPALFMLVGCGSAAPKFNMRVQHHPHTADDTARQLADAAAARLSRV